MSLRDRHVPLCVAVLALAALTTAACASEDDGGGTAADTVTVSSTDDACDVGTTELPAGTHRFEVTNKGSKVTEFYVYGEGDKVDGRGREHRPRPQPRAARRAAGRRRTRRSASPAWPATGSARS